MVRADPFDIWQLAERPDLTIKYERGMAMPYYGYEQLRRAFEAGMKANPPTTVTASTSGYVLTGLGLGTVLRRERAKRAKKRRK